MDLDVDLIQNVDNTGDYQMVPKPNTVTFDEGFFLAVKAIRMLRSKNKRTVFVGIAGPSGSGKTTLARKITDILPQSLIISMDNYLDASRQVIDGNFDDFRLVDSELLVSNLKDLQSGDTTQMPLYDFKQSKRSGYRTISVPESKVVIVEGIYALHESIRAVVDLKISVSGGIHFDLIKRIFRDIQRTGQQPKECMAQITETVFPMYKLLIEPDLKHADIRIINHFNPFSGLLTPTYTLKSPKLPSREEINRVLSQDGKEEIRQRTDNYKDIYFGAPPNPEHPSRGNSEAPQFIRLRNSEGHYIILFSEVIKESDFIISPRIEFQVDASTIGGLMTLGYRPVAVINRTSDIFSTDSLNISFDHIEELGKTFIQIKGTDREEVSRVGTALGLDPSYVPRSYIEMYIERYNSVQIPSLNIPARL
eukprot:gb/GECH01011996.1/.p1 GENE.gb/GECH01011996.1/~~gb/GECH01011996.1/.p1  ORF type:complete len:422 (+),score=71.77 gb/GECH01011996.1/:1-1266(+)